MSKILIVEDHAESRYLLERLLASRDHHIIAAKDGSEALSLARQNSPEIIISDIMMPVMNGFKLCYEIKKDPFLCRIPFIFYTATFVEKRDEELAMSLGASRFVIKPKEGDEFIRILDNVLNEHRHGTLAVPEASLENEEILLEMYDNILVRKLAETVEKLQNEQRALIQSERRLKEAQELAHVGHWELDLKNDSLEWSDEIYRILGVTPGAFEPSYKTFVTMEVVHPDDRDRVAKAHKDSLAKRTPCDIEYRLLFKNGTVKYVNERFQTIFDNNGMPFCSMGTVQDISERREAEEEREKLQAQLNQAQKLESIGILAGGVAHDFNNKLSVILAYTQMAMEDLGESDPIYRDLREVLNAGQSSAEIVRQLLAFARRQTIAPRVLDMNQTVEGMLNMLGRLIGENIELVWQPDMTLWPVKMNPTQIDQILANLCVNARDAITDVGTITISTENVVLDDITVGDTEWVPGSYVLLKVVDDGIGMDKATLENAFEPFFTTKAVGKGTGLGLSTVYGIVKQNRGFINVLSEPGKGTVVKIYLPPHSEKEEETVEVIQEEIPYGRGETILVVEDEASILRLAGTILERLGYNVLATEHAGDALKIAREHGDEIHLLIIDVVLPEMNGKDLAEEIIRIRPNIRVLFMSGYSSDIIGRHGVLNEGVHFLQKPFSLNMMARKVGEMLNR